MVNTKANDALKIFASSKEGGQEMCQLALCQKPTDRKIYILSKTLKSQSQELQLLSPTAIIIICSLEDPI